MSSISEGPPDENEAYESWDEALDEEDRLGDGPEGARELDSEIEVDEVALREIGANLDDPDHMAVRETLASDPDKPGGSAD
jgi:hypothetical protein